MRYFLILLVAAMITQAGAQTAPKPTTSRPVASELQASSPVTPGTVAEPSWDKEPEAFLGVKFNEPFNVSPCPVKTYGQYIKTEMVDHEAMVSIKGVCLDTTDTLYKYQNPENGTYKLSNLPSLGIGYAVSVHTKGSLVSKITVSLKQANFGVLLTAFKDRYGLPTAIESNRVKSNAGAEFNAADVHWKGKKLSIRMYERMGKIDESLVVISDNAIMESEAAAQRAKRASEAQKF